jgi:F-type H+-transporting ATPase subunit delta
VAGNDVPKRYAEALAEVTAGFGAEDRTRVRDELRGFRSAVHESFDLANLLHNPSVTSGDRLQVLSAVLEKLGVSETTSRFLRLLTERGRMGLLDGIVEAYERIDDARSGIVRAQITSATELSSATLQRVTAALEARTGRKLDVRVDVDPELIGGLRAQVGSLVFDGSVRSELNRLRERLQD